MHRRRSRPITTAALAVGLLVVISSGVLAQSPSPSGPSASSSPAASRAPFASASPAMFIVTSEGFVDGDPIPERYTCDGDNVSPPLAWEGVPAGTVSLALIVADPNADGWAHWVVFDIDPTLGGLAEGASGSSDGFREGMNDYPVAGWAGPCPEAGTQSSYGFGLFALDAMLGLDETASAADLRALMDGHILARAELSGVRAR